MGLIIHIDGGARGNPGPAGAGVVVQREDGTLIHEGAYFLGHQTNNAAEYHALIRGLQRAARCGDQPISVCSDSELLVRQITGEYRVKSPKLAQLFEQAQMLLLKVSCWKVQHVRREANKRADELANLAMDRERDVVVYDADDGPTQRPGGGAGGASVRPAPAATGGVGQTSGGVGPSPGGAGGASAQERSGGPGGALGGDAPRAVRVSLATACKPGACPAGGFPAEPLVISAVMPAGMCVHAAQAILPTLLAIQNTDAQEYAAIPTMTVRCSRAECGASFHVSPQTRNNGKH